MPGVAPEQPQGSLRYHLVSGFVAPVLLPSNAVTDAPPLSTKIEVLEAATASLSLEAQQRAAKDAQKKAAKAEAAEQKHADLIAKSVVTIKRIERNKRKFVTAVIGLEAFGLDLKKVFPPRGASSSPAAMHLPVLSIYSFAAAR